MFLLISGIFQGPVYVTVGGNKSLVPDTGHQIGGNTSSFTPANSILMGHIKNILGKCGVQDRDI
jgi:hypothetical protein